MGININLEGVKLMNIKFQFTIELALKLEL
jgi:hypothetical protein